MTLRQRTITTAVFALATFVSAFLLFQVQPLLAKSILPWFGGTPAVWTTCMLVFQVLLFAGYAYAHGTATWLSPRMQCGLHVTLLLLALAVLPVLPDAAWKPAGDETPVLRIVGLLLATVGLPYFLLSATGPLLQVWYRRATGGAVPYRLYALSNVGSLLALISYPFVIEPAWSTSIQALVWSGGFLLFVALCSAAGWFASVPEPVTAAAELPGNVSAPSQPLPILLWFALAAVPSLMLLAITSQVCMDVAVVPFLWIVPLTLYLLTFILCFDSDRWYQRRAAVVSTGVTLACVTYLLQGEAGGSIVLQSVVYFAGLFCTGMVCHGELVRLRPQPRHLTAFYLTISAGGAAGGLFAGLVAPSLFRGYFELPIAMLACVVALTVLFLREYADRFPRLPRWLPGMIGSLVLLGGIAICSGLGATTPTTLAVSRNFYGVLRVEDLPAEGLLPARRALSHGRIRHGVQLRDDPRIPTAYYVRNSAVGRLLEADPNGPPRHIGMVGLGVGTLATYGRSTDRIRFYEINHDVIQLARAHFTFLRDSQAEVTIQTGDARLVLEREPPQQFDLLVLDAFSGDAIPAHLLTREALEVYLRHLQLDGVLAFHVSNLHFDLCPVLQGLADSAGLASRSLITPGDRTQAGERCLWVALSRNPASLAAIPADPAAPQSPCRSLLWTDDFSNLFDVLR